MGNVPFIDKEGSLWYISPLTLDQERENKTHALFLRILSLESRQSGMLA